MDTYFIPKTKFNRINSLVKFSISSLGYRTTATTYLRFEGVQNEVGCPIHHNAVHRGMHCWANERDKSLQFVALDVNQLGRFPLPPHRFHGGPIRAFDQQQFLDLRGAMRPRWRR